MLWLPSTPWAQGVASELLLRNEASQPVAQARLTVQTANGAVVAHGLSDEAGRVALPELARGQYVLRLAAPGYGEQELPYTHTGRPQETTITLLLATLTDGVTVTARRGLAEDAAQSGALVTIRDGSDWQGRPLATLGNALEGAPGVLVQQSTAGQASPFLRGLTGYQVLNLIDGIRYNNSTFRSGPNQYLAFIEPGQAQRIEALLGPASVAYGSDALGGALNTLTAQPVFHPPGWQWHGEFSGHAASADAAGGGTGQLMFGGPRLALLAGGAWQKHNDSRAGQGEDSHHALRRFFGLTGAQVRQLTGDRRQDTGFARHGWHTKLAAQLAHEQSLTMWYQRGVLDGVRGYKDLWGGLGRLQSKFEPQTLDFCYTRYEKLRLGRLDSLSGTFSLNAQRDGTTQQNLLSTDRVRTDDNAVTAYGAAGQASTSFGARQTVVFGGEMYHELIRASRVEFDPMTRASTQKRALYPSGSRYTTLGLFAQHSGEWFQGRLRSAAGGRFTRAGFSANAAANRTSAGASLGVADAEGNFHDLTFNAALTWRIGGGWSLHALSGRGFRAPNLNDLGALGLNDLGYEVPAYEALRASAQAGASDGENALPGGKPVAALRAESLYNYELGLSYQAKKAYLRAQIFDSELHDPIVRRTLLFAADQPPASLAGIPVTPIAQTSAQRARNVVTVATALDPRAVKAFVNDGRARYYGLESLARAAISARWQLEGQYSFIAGRELDPNRNIRRLPPQQGWLSVRYLPAGLRGRLTMVEVSGELAGAQTRLSGGDLTDERIGASFRRRDISDFFRSARVSAWVIAGADGRLGTADDVFSPTGETLAQISDRALPVGAIVNGARITDDASRAPLFLKTPGYAALHLRGSWRLSENAHVDFAVRNLLDKNYRIHGSGIDAPGRDLAVRLRYQF
ncbi:MAG: TonB-dependent receptor domain-containing protein [Blastocatellia bacterium]